MGVRCPAEYLDATCLAAGGSVTRRRVPRGKQGSASIEEGQEKLVPFLAIELVNQFDFYLFSHLLSISAAKE